MSKSQSPFKKPIRIKSERDFDKQRTALLNKLFDEKTGYAWKKHYEKRIVQLEKAYQKFVLKEAQQEVLSGWTPFKGSYESYAKSQGYEVEKIKKIREDIHRITSKRQRVSLKPTFPHAYNKHFEKLREKGGKPPLSKIDMSFGKDFFKDPYSKDNLLFKQEEVDNERVRYDKRDMWEYEGAVEEWRSGGEAWHPYAARSFLDSSRGDYVFKQSSFIEWSKQPQEYREKVPFKDWYEIDKEAFANRMKREEGAHPKPEREKFIPRHKRKK